MDISIFLVRKIRETPFAMSQALKVIEDKTLTADNCERE